MAKLTNIRGYCDGTGDLDLRKRAAYLDRIGNHYGAAQVRRMMQCCAMGIAVRKEQYPPRSSSGNWVRVVYGHECDAALGKLRRRRPRSPFSRRAFRGLGLPPGANPSSLPWCGGIKPLQTMLKDLGYYAGSIDGSVGTGTTNAIVAAQRALGSPTGAITKNFCSSLANAWTQKMVAPAAPAPGAPTTSDEGGFAKTGGDIVPGDPGTPAMVGEDEGVMAKWQAMPTAYKAGIIGGGVLLLAGGGYAAYRMTR